MIIRFEKSGGFTGMHVATTVDTNDLSPEEATRLLHELEQSGLLDTNPEALESTPDENAPHGAADVVTYELTLEVGSYEQTYCMTEETVPDSAQPLFRQLIRFARSSSGSYGPKN